MSDWSCPIASGRNAFLHILLEWRETLAGQVDYFYGEARTETAKFHAIFDELGWRPLALLPRKDCFYNRRESEVIYAWHYDSQSRVPRLLTPMASQVASTVLQQRAPAVRVFVPPPGGRKAGACSVHYAVAQNGDGHLRLALGNGASLDALVWPASRNSEKVAVHAPDIASYATLLQQYLAEVRGRGLEYVEVYVAADSPARQRVLEELGFSPTGFLPSWYALGCPKLGDYVTYSIHFASNLPDCAPTFTSHGAFLQAFMTEPSSGRVIPSQEVNVPSAPAGLPYSRAVA